MVCSSTSKNHVQRTEQKKGKNNTANLITANMRLFYSSVTRSMWLCVISPAHALNIKKTAQKNPPGELRPMHCKMRPRDFR